MIPLLPLPRARGAVVGVVVGVLALPASRLGAAPYQDAVLALEPSYYYELNETSTDGGVIDTTGHATPGSYNGDYINGPPMVGGPGPLEVFGGIPVPGVGGEANLAHYSNNAGHILLGPGDQYGSSAMTVALFLKAGGAAGGDRIFTNNLEDNTMSFQIVTANDGLVLAVDPNVIGFEAERTLFLEDNSGPDRRLIDSNAGWFHVVASTEGATGTDRAGSFRLWINGVERTENLQPNATGWGIDTEFAKIGGRREDPFDSTTHSGAQDEVAIWLDRVLTDTEVASLWAAATGGGGVAPPFLITDVSRNAATKDVTVVFSSVANSLYAIDRSPNLATWTELAGSLQATASQTSYVDTSAEVHAAGVFYYRVRRVQ